METLYEMPIARPPGRPTVVDDPAHIHLRGRARGMLEAGLSRGEVLRRLGVSRVTLWRWAKLDEPRTLPRVSQL